MSDIPQHPLREDLSKFSPDGLRTFRWNELDKPPMELYQGIADFFKQLVMDNKFNEDDFKKYFFTYKNEHGLKCYQFNNPYRSGQLKLKKNKASKSLNCGVPYKYRTDWTWFINNKTYILMRAEIPMNHLASMKGKNVNRSGSVFYAELITKLMFCTYPKDKWNDNEFNDKSLISEWIFVGAGLTEEHLIIYYLKDIHFEEDRMYMFERLLSSKRESWKEYFLERENEVCKLRSEVMGFPMQKRTYSYYGNAFEFSFQVPDIIDYIAEEDRILSVQDLLTNGLMLGVESVKRTKKLKDSRKKVKERIENTTIVPKVDFGVDPEPQNKSHERWLGLIYKPDTNEKLKPLYPPFVKDDSHE